jgi:hypothetical protein
MRLELKTSQTSTSKKKPPRLEESAKTPRTAEHAKEFLTEALIATVTLPFITTSLRPWGLGGLVVSALSVATVWQIFPPLTVEISVDNFYSIK